MASWHSRRRLTLSPADGGSPEGQLRSIWPGGDHREPDGKPWSPVAPASGRKGCRRRSGAGAGVVASAILANCVGGRTELEHLHSEPSVAPRSRVGRMSEHPRGWNYHESDRRAPGAPLRSTGATGPPGAGVRMREAWGVRCSRRVGIGEGRAWSRQREGVRIGASGSSQRDRPGLQGAWRAGCSADVGIGEARRNARQRGRVRGSQAAGIRGGVGRRASGRASKFHGALESEGAFVVARAEARSTVKTGWVSQRANGGPRKRHCDSTGAGGAAGSGRANLRSVGHIGEQGVLALALSRAFVAGSLINKGSRQAT